MTGDEAMQLMLMNFSRFECSFQSDVTVWKARVWKATLEDIAKIEGLNVLAADSGHVFCVESDGGEGELS